MLDWHISLWLGKRYLKGDPWEEEAEGRVLSGKGKIDIFRILCYKLNKIVVSGVDKRNRRSVPFLQENTFHSTRYIPELYNI